MMPVLPADFRFRAPAAVGVLRKNRAVRHVSIAQPEAGSEAKLGNRARDSWIIGAANKRDEAPCPSQVVWRRPHLR